MLDNFKSKLGHTEVGSPLASATNTYATFVAGSQWILLYNLLSRGHTEYYRLYFQELKMNK